MLPRLSATPTTAKIPQQVDIFVMTEEKKRLDKLRWEAERKQKQSQLNEKLKLLLTKDKYKFYLLKNLMKNSISL